MVRVVEVITTLGELTVCIEGTTHLAQQTIREEDMIDGRDLLGGVDTVLILIIPLGVALGLVNQSGNIGKLPTGALTLQNSSHLRDGLVIVQIQGLVVPIVDISDQDDLITLFHQGSNRLLDDSSLSLAFDTTTLVLRKGCR